MKSGLRSWRLSILVFAVILALVFLALNSSSQAWFPRFAARSAIGDDGFPIGPVSYDFVKSRPEAYLYYPNSKEFARFGGPEQDTDEGINPAFSGAILLSGDPQSDIFQWYRDWLAGHNWKASSDFTRTSDQVSLEGYVRGPREWLYVAIDDPTSLSATLGRSVPTGETVFEIRYVVRPGRK
jgi:hypothetical protein